MNKRFAIYTSREDLVADEAACQAHMQATVPGYCAERWADILVNEKTGKLSFYTDFRVEAILSRVVLDSRIAVADDIDWIVEPKVSVIVAPGQLAEGPAGKKI